MPPCNSINDIYAIATISGIDQVYAVANVPGQGGGVTAYHTFITNMWNHYTGVSPGPTGCNWWYTRLNNWNSQYQAITHPYHQSLKLAKITFGVQAIQSCGCSGAPILGCTDPIATNYLSTATADDGSCTYSTVLGCTTSTALNYNSSATVDDGSCIHASPCDRTAMGSICCCQDPLAVNFASQGVPPPWTNCDHLQSICIYPSSQIRPIDDNTRNVDDEYFEYDNEDTHSSYKDIIKKIKDGRRL